MAPRRISRWPVTKSSSDARPAPDSRNASSSCRHHQQIARANAEPAVQLANYKSWLLGVRTAMVFFDMKDSSDIPAITEPYFQKVNAAVALVPVMNQDDLRAGMVTPG